MSRRDAVLIASRGFAIYMAVWASVEVTYLADNLHSLFHHLSQRSVLATQDYWTNYYVLRTALNVVRMLGLFLGAIFFWRCGPRVEALFAPQEAPAAPGQSTLDSSISGQSMVDHSK